MNNKRIFSDKNYQVENSMSYKDLKELLKKEKRQEDSKIIREMLFNKIFARAVFVICIGLNLFFVTLGILNYLGMIG